MIYDKPFKTYSDQITHLKEERNLIINNESFAMKALSVISYYDLINGYKDIFMDNDKFHNGVSLEFLCAFHNFNTAFQSILFKYSVYVENLFKNNLAYILAENFGVHQNDYLNHSNYINPINSTTRRARDKTINKIKNVLSNTRVEDPTKFYLNNHNHVPPWILFKNIKFGDSIDLYKHLKSSEKRKLQSLLLHFNCSSVSGSPFSECLTIVRKFRNVIAHNLKFITHKSSQSLDVEALPDIFQTTLLKGFPKNRIHNSYAMVVSLLYLLSEPFLMVEMLQDLESEISKRTDEQAAIVALYFWVIGFPTDFIQRIKDFIIEYEKLYF